MSNRNRDMLSRRHLLASAALSAGPVLAGCSSGGNGGDSGGGETTTAATAETTSTTKPGTTSQPEATAETTTTAGEQGTTTTEPTTTDGQSADTLGLQPVDVDGEVVKNSVDGLEIVGTASYESTAGWEYGQGKKGVFVLIITLENTGTKMTNPEGYSYDLVLYDENDEVIVFASRIQALDGRIPPGGTGRLARWTSKQEDVARWELTVSCSSPLADGVYCG